MMFRGMSEVQVGRLIHRAVHRDPQVVKARARLVAYLDHEWMPFHDRCHDLCHDVDVALDEAFEKVSDKFDIDVVSAQQFVESYLQEGT